MQESHATVASLLSRIKAGPEGTMSLRTTTPNAADKALCGADANVLYMLEVQIKQCSPTLDAYLERLQEQVDLVASIWQPVDGTKGISDAAAE